MSNSYFEKFIASLRERATDNALDLNSAVTNVSLRELRTLIELAEVGRYDITSLKNIVNDENVVKCQTYAKAALSDLERIAQEGLDHE